MGIGEGMKKVRKKKGLKQKDVAKDLGCSQSYISAVEQGVEVPKARFVKLFCLQYDISENDLVKGNDYSELGDKSSDELIEEHMSSQERLVKYFEALNQIGKDIILGKAAELYHSHEIELKRESAQEQRTDISSLADAVSWSPISDDDRPKERRGIW